MVNQGPIPDEIPRNLEEELLLEAAKAGDAIEIQGSPLKPLGDAPRLVANYGGQLGDWVKMSTSQGVIIEGAYVQVHWFRNRQSDQSVEFKFKRQYPKTTHKNQ